MKRAAKFFLIFFFSIVSILVLISVFFGYRDKPLNELKEKYATPPSAFLTVDGMNVHYRDEGNKTDSLPLVLIHGTGSSLQTFDEWATELKKEKRVIRLDIPAFGLTGPFPNRQYGIDHYVVFMNQFLTKLGIKKCIMAGNSLGGQIAWNFTLQFPEMVAKLVLIDAAGYPMQSQSTPIAFKIARIPVLNKLMTFITPRFMARSSVKNVYADKSKVTEQLVDRYFELALREGNRQALADRLTIALDTGLVPSIKNIRQPSLILWGEEDLLTPVKYAYRFHNDLPNDTMVVLKNVGHVPMEESPAESLAVLRAFLKKI